MSTQKVTRWFFVLTFILFFGMLLTLPAQASAAQSAGAFDNSCLTCHEDLYYIHDTGCWYCMTEAHKDRCVDCHEGDPTTMKVELSHLGMLPHPQENGGAKCKECHTAQDVQVRMANFEANSGFDEVIKAEAYIPSVEAESGFPEVAEAMVEWKWAAGASIVFGLWLLLVLFSPLKP